MHRARRSSSSRAGRQIAGTRDRIAHGYFDINLDVVWDILSLDLPKLERELEYLITRLA